MSLLSLEQVVADSRLGDSSLFDACDERQIAKLFRSARTLRYGRGKLVYEQGAEARDAYWLLGGGIKLNYDAGNARIKVMQLVYPRALFGLDDLLVDRHHHFGAVTFTPSEILVVDGDSLVDVMKANARFAVALLRYLGGQYRENADWWGRVNQLGAREKVAAYLLAETDDRAGEDAVRASPTRRDIASLLGITPETLSRELAYFRERDWVRFERSGALRVRQADSLRAIVQP